VFGWLPRWHPVIWIIVIVLVVAIVQDPAAMGARAHSLIHAGQHAIGQLIVFVESI
jgi:hypothetical protein